MLSKKIFMIHDCCFNLPDDFHGTCGEALMLLAQYRLEQEKKDKIKNAPQIFDKGAYNTCIELDDYKVAIAYQIYELQDDDTWKATVKRRDD